MVEENEKESQQNKSDDENNSESNGLFNELKEFEPERDVPLPDESGGDGVSHKSLTEREEESPNKSDVKIMTETLFPDMGNPTLNRLMVSEVFPESYRSLQAMLVKDRIKNSMPEQSVVDVIVEVNTPESIAFGREGRFDGLAIIGVANRLESEKNSNKQGF
jgi:hypothetical protein